MANGFWIKLYHEILYDPKMGRLPDNVWRRCIELFLMAGERAEGGKLPPVSDMTWSLRINPSQFEDEISQLLEVGILSTDEDGGLYVTKFRERQGRIPAADKQKAYRDRKRQEAIENAGKDPEPPEKEPDPPKNQDDTPKLPERYHAVTNGNADIDKIRLDKSESRSIKSRARDVELDRRFARTLLCVCGFSPDGPISDNVLRDASATTQLMINSWGATVAQLDKFKLWWWGKSPPSLRQVRDEWGKFINAKPPQEKANGRTSNLNPEAKAAYERLRVLTEQKSNQRTSA